MCKKSTSHFHGHSPRKKIFHVRSTKNKYKYRTAHTGNKPEDCMKWKNGYTTNTITDFNIFFQHTLFNNP